MTSWEGACGGPWSISSALGCTVRLHPNLCPAPSLVIERTKALTGRTHGRTELASRADRDATRAAYNRVEMVALRKPEMNRWGRYVCGEDAPPTGNVVDLGEARKRQAVTVP